MKRQTLTRYALEYSRAYPYFLNHIKSKKALARHVEDKIDFEEGRFFTLLPEDAFLERLYSFDAGRMIPQTEPIVKNAEGKGSWQLVTSLNDQLGEFVWSYLGQKDSHFAVCESYDLLIEDSNIEIQNVSLVPFEREVYYVLNSKNTLDEVTETVKECKLVWHFLGVLTTGPHQFSGEFTEEDFERICLGAKYLIGSAYDGEGFICWERTKEAG